MGVYLSFTKTWVCFSAKHIIPSAIAEQKNFFLTQFLCQEQSKWLWDYRTLGMNSQPVPPKREPTRPQWQTKFCRALMPNWCCVKINNPDLGLFLSQTHYPFCHCQTKKLKFCRAVMPNWCCVKINNPLMMSWQYKGIRLLEQNKLRLVLECLYVSGALVPYFFPFCANSIFICDLISIIKFNPKAEKVGNVQIGSDVSY